MFDTFAQFHFIRPLWLFALIPVIVIIAGLMLKSTRRNQWTAVIDQHLLKHLLIGQNKIQQSRISPLLMLAISLLLAVLAMAGPTWQERPLPVFETEISKVILLDLSLSMESTDIKPSRLTRAKHKINDLLAKTKEGQVALVVYAGDAFIISPLTTDANTILTMVPSLSPSLMPVLGSEPQTAFELADELLTNAGIFSGQIIWITDGISDQDYGLVSEQLKKSRHQISILAVGTKDGAPIPLPDGQGFLKDSQGSIVLPTLKLAPLEQLAKLSNGTVTQLTADDRDIDQLLSSLKAPQEFVSTDDDLQMDTWIEFGPWLLLPIILIAALSFRKGVIVALFIYFIPLPPLTIQAAETAAETATDSIPEIINQPEQSNYKKHWDNLWQTADQQAAKAFNNKQHSAAADLFEHPDWKSAALYKAGEYNAATDLLSANKSATSNYNRGNALAQLQRYEESIAAYDDALQQNPNMEDAVFNKQLVEKLLKQQQEQQEQENQDGDQQEQNDQQQQQQDGEQQEGEEEEGEQQEQDQQQQEGDQQQDEEKESEQRESELEQMTEAEREQVLEQWLRMIKDDPGGLLRRKMYMEYQRRQQQGKKLQNKGEQVW